MSDYADHWCEHYGKGSAKCGQCVKKESEQERPELRVILRRRTDKLMELDKNRTPEQRINAQEKVR